MTKRLLAASALTLMLAAGTAYAQTTYPTTDTGTTGTTDTGTVDPSATDTTGSVGVPNTGAGGNALENEMVLGASLAIALGSAAALYAAKRTV